MRKLAEVKMFGGYLDNVIKIA